MANYPQLDNARGVWNLREVYDAVMGGDWPNANAIGLFGGGYISAGTAAIDKIIFSTPGNATDFGDLSINRWSHGHAASFTRGVWAGGQSTPGGIVNVIDYITFPTEGNAADFGDLLATRETLDGSSNSIRGIFTGGNPGSIDNVMQYITIASTGNATDFGDLTVARQNHGSASSPTRQVNMGGATPSASNVIDFTEIMTTGNAVDFGDLTAARSNGMPVSSSTRGVYASGSPSTNVDFITIASQGNGTDYADLSVARSAGGGADNSVKGVFAGSYPNSNTIDSLIIATGGTATDFGDMTAAREKAKGVSNSHGGLNDGYQGTRPLPIGGTGRGIVLGGYNSPAAKSTIEFFNIASTGNGAVFGDASLAASFGSANSSSTRMIMQGGYTDALTTETDTIQYVEMQSQGNGADFGNLLSSRANSASTGSCSTTRGLSEAGGTGGGGVVNEIEYITMASVGNGTDFGDLTVAREVPAACSSPTRGVCGGGDTPSA